MALSDKEIERILRNVDRSAGEDLQSEVEKVKDLPKRARTGGAILGASTGALAAGLMDDPDKSVASRMARLLTGVSLGGVGGYVAGAFYDKNKKKKIYEEVAKRRARELSNILGGLDHKRRKEVENHISMLDRGVKTKEYEYGEYRRGKGVLSEDDKINTKHEGKDQPLISLLFSGINSSILDSKSKANSELAELFYNKHGNKFSDVQANTIFDDPITSDAYVDKVVAKISANRKKTGKYPKIRLVGYSAGGRGVVNFLKKMRERDPKFKVDEIIGIDPYIYPWENVPKELRDSSNPVADKIVYARLADKITGSNKTGFGKLKDVLSNIGVAAVGRKLDGLSGRNINNAYVHGIAHTNAEEMYNEAIRRIAEMG